MTGTRHAALTFNIERITPALAAEYLEKNGANRPLSRAVEKLYASAMVRDEWMMNAEAVKFDWNGNLVDGQHRLAGVVRARRVIEFLVVRGLDPAAFKTIDTGRPRNAADMVALRGIPNAHAVAAAYRLLWRYVHNDRSRQRISNTQLIEFMDRHPMMPERTKESLKNPLYCGSILSQATHAFGFYMMSSVDLERAGRFWSCLARDRVDAPRQVALLRRRLVETDQEFVKPTPSIKLAWLIVAWNHFIADAKLDRISRTFDEMPRFRPAPKFP